jgi:4'-phosphopantetheinyl transferase
MMKSVRENDLDDGVVVWTARLSELRDSLTLLEALLDTKERERALRFRFPEDRARFVAGRGLLRQGLRLYAPDVPPSIELTYTGLGRPVVPNDHDAPSFSISHTRDVVALAFANEAQVGIDLEYMQPTVDLIELAERILSEEDFQAFQAFPRLDMQLAFYRAWTRKEAYLKARGEGIATGLQDVSVSFAPEKTSALVDRRDASASVWRLHLLPVPEDYVGSLACDDANRDVKCYSACLEKDRVRLDSIAA